VHLVGFVVARQHVHHEVHAEAQRDLALAFAGHAAPDRQSARPDASTAQAAAQSLPPIITGVTPSLRLRKGMPSICSASGGAASTQTSRPVATGEILQQVEGAGQHVIIGGIGSSGGMSSGAASRRRRRPLGVPDPKPPIFASRVSKTIMPPERR
jgi:hypothetical protein